METFISILRGINVSGHRLINMKALKEMYESLGFSSVKTYIQSGNVIFGSNSKETGPLGKIISGKILSVFGFEVPVLVIRHDELEYTSIHNPFILERGVDVTKLHVTFLSETPAANLQDNLDRSAYLPDEFDIRGKVVYLFCPDGYGNTKLNNGFFEKQLKVQATTRNWKTIQELVKMSM